MSKEAMWWDKPWNVTRGCTHASSPGCDNCWARDMHKRFRSEPWENVSCLPDRLDVPIKRRKPTRWFVNNTSDLFHETVPFEFIAAIFGVMAACPQHTFQVLTKRPARMLEVVNEISKRPDVIADCVAPYLGAEGTAWIANYVNGWSRPKNVNDGNPADGTVPRWPLPNVWLGVTCEDQQRANERIPLLLKCPAAIRFVSAEPLLSHIDLRRYLNEERRNSVSCSGGAGLVLDSVGRNDPSACGFPRRRSTNDASDRASPGGSEHLQTRWISARDVSPHGSATARGGASSRVDVLQPSDDPGCHGGQSQERGQGRPPPGQPRTGDSSRECQARDSRAGAQTEGAGRRTERAVEGDGGAGDGDTRARWNSLAEPEGDRATVWSDSECRVCDRDTQELETRWLTWVIVGGESGPRARQCDVRWIRSIRDQCEETGTACFVKQWGSNPVLRDRFDVSDSRFVDLDANGWDEDQGAPTLRNRAGADPAEWPADLRVREYPQ